MKILLVLGFFFMLLSCSDKSYPCPDTGSNSASAVSSHDSGRSKKEKKYKENGLINKKKPKKLSKK
jgi:hypothetical protein